MVIVWLNKTHTVKAPIIHHHELVRRASSS